MPESAAVATISHELRLSAASTKLFSTDVPNNPRSIQLRLEQKHRRKSNLVPAALW